MNQAQRIIESHIVHGLTVFELAGLLWAGGVSRLLLSAKPVTIRLIIGELLLSIPGAVFINSFGVLQGMSPAWILIMGSVVSLVGIEYLIKWLRKRFVNFLDRN